MYVYILKYDKIIVVYFMKGTIVNERQETYGHENTRSRFGCRTYTRSDRRNCH